MVEGVDIPFLVVAGALVLLASQLTIRRRRLEAELAHLAVGSQVDPVTDVLVAEAFQRRVEVEKRRAEREGARLVSVWFPRAAPGRLPDPSAFAKALIPGEIPGSRVEGGVDVLLLPRKEVESSLIAQLVDRVAAAGIDARDAVLRQLVDVDEVQGK